jgi:carbonic anhydrase/acetyltransferase-like protein (isoleucine patch superfamily)
MTHFVHPAAFVCGRVRLGDRASVWAGAVLRGDSDEIHIGDESNVQDGAVVHCDPGLPALVGNRVGIGHRAVVHGCVIEDDCLIGIGAIVLNGARVGAGSVIGAGAVVPEGTVIPPDSVVLGVPGRVVRQVDDALRARQKRTVAAYLELQRRHRAGEFPAYPAGLERGSGGVWV